MNTLEFSLRGNMSYPCEVDRDCVCLYVCMFILWMCFVVFVECLKDLRYYCIQLSVVAIFWYLVWYVWTIDPPLQLQGIVGTKLRDFKLLGLLLFLFLEKENKNPLLDEIFYYVPRRVLHMGKMLTLNSGLRKIISRSENMKSGKDHRKWPDLCQLLLELDDSFLLLSTSL